MKYIPKFLRQLIAMELVNAIAELDADDLATFKALAAAKIAEIFKL